MKPEKTTSWMQFLAMGMLVCTAIFGSACGSKYPKCSADKDCKEAEFCVNGLCQMCRTDSDCKAGQSCKAGRCEATPGYCDSSKDCKTGEECLNNRCAVPESKPVASTSSDNEAANKADVSACNVEPVYFAFDSSSLEAQEREKVAKIKRCIENRQSARVQITGHTDPRGTEEYNLALGEKRAQSVKEYLISLGTDKAKTSATSMGEEGSTGNDESQWSQERRADIKAE